MEQHNLPTLVSLHHSPEEAFKNDQFNLLMAQPPHDTWLKKHPIVNNHKYLPIDKVEYLLTRVFGQWRREIKEVKQLFNSVVVTVRLHVKHPVTGEWTFQDGVGAVAAQVNSGASAADLGSIKANAMQIGAPAAASYALKDAAENFGRLFGKDLNKQGLEFKGSYSAAPPDDPTTPPPSKKDGELDLEITTQF